MMRKHALQCSALLTALLPLVLSSCGAREDLGETLATAGINTLIGMGTVFIVLIFISLVISLFKLINKAESRKRKKSEDRKSVPLVVTAPNSPAPDPAAPQESVDDTELVAVIAAAIAAYESVPADSFIVRSVKKVSANGWKR